MCATQASLFPARSSHTVTFDCLTAALRVLLGFDLPPNGTYFPCEWHSENRTRDGGVLTDG
jgi:hypothetical protein